MKRATMLLVVAVVVLGGCGESESGSSPESAAPTTTEESADGEGLYTATRDSFCPPTVPAEIAARWCSLVTGYDVSGHTLVIQTDLYEDSEGETFAEEFLLPFMGEANAHGSDYGVERIEVTGPQRRVHASHLGRGDLGVSRQPVDVALDDLVRDATHRRVAELGEEVDAQDAVVARGRPALQPMP